MRVYDMLNSSDISPDELYLSSGFQNFMESTLNDILRRNRKKVIKLKITNRNCTDTAETTQTEMVINYGYYVIQKLENKYEQFKFIRGFIGHELGHLLFDDFYMLKRIQDMWKIKSIYPLSHHQSILNCKQLEAYNDIKRCINNPYLNNKLLHVYLDLDNRLSDAFVNTQTINNVPQYSADLKFVLKQMKKSLSPYSLLMNANLSRTDIMLNIIHRYAVYNVIYTEYDNEYVKKTIELIPLIEKIRTTIHADTRTTYYQILLCSIWDVIKFDFELESNGDNLDNEVEQRHETKSDSNDKTEMFDFENIRDTVTIRPQLSSMPSYAAKEECIKVELLSVGELLESTDLVAENKADTLIRNITFVNDTIEDFEDNEISYGVSNNLDEAKSTQAFNNAIQEFLRDKKEKEKAINHRAELKAFDSNLKYPLIHTGLEVLVSRIMGFEQDTKIVYDTYIDKEVKPIANRIVKEIMNVPLERRRAGRMPGYYSGKRINFPAIMRNDIKLFERLKLPTVYPTIAMLIIVDESGSTKGERTFYSRFTALVLIEVCKKLGIKLGIIGHKADAKNKNAIINGEYEINRKKYDVLLNVYADYNNDINDKYRVMTMQPYGCNRDGYALAFGCERLLLQKADIKICVNITDGKPNARKNNYINKIAINDLQYLKEKYEKEGIRFVVAAIGDDKKEIKSIYGEAFLDIKNPKELPYTLAGLLKEMYL